MLVLVGGFLGAGKTSLLAIAARLLTNQGRRVAVIVNDQGAGLVDTQTLRASGLAAEEIGGGCFCCRFSEFVRSAERLLAAAQPDVILAEPVGSCADLSATILQPLKKFYAGSFDLAPLTVLVDPGRELADPHMAYLFEKQLAEADTVWFSKADLYADRAGKKLSARTSEGVAGWLEEVLGHDTASGTRLLDIDYARYAEAEASLGWLNWSADLRLGRARTPAAVAGPLLELIERGLTLEQAAIAHLKIFVEAGTGWIKAGVCRNGAEPAVEGQLDAAPARHHRVVLNLRASAAPELLQSLVARGIHEMPGRWDVRHEEAFRPAPPEPEHRWSEIV